MSEQTLESDKIARLQSYATLINQKILVPSNSSSYFAVEKYYFFEMMIPFIESIDLDERWYLATHPDVREAITRGLVESGQQHYVKHGYYEHRLPYRVLVEEDWYVSAYPDVKEAIERQDFPSAQAHFEMSGFREGRLPFPNFALHARGGRRS